MTEKMKMTGLPDKIRLICKEETDSTNTDVKQAALSGQEEGYTVLAEKQTAGKGRRGRVWTSPSGTNLYFSILLKPEIAVDKASMVTLLMGMAAAGAIESIGLPAKIKWPNDVVVNGKKVCGILTEMNFLDDGSYAVTVGTGINVNQEQFPEEIRKTATSLKLEKGAFLEREELLTEVLCRFWEVYSRFKKDGNFAELREEYEKLLVNRGRAVEVLDPKGAWRGIAEGINDTGELMVRHEDGRLEAVYAGEVSVRGIYGYV